MREPGFYWVKHIGRRRNARWIVAECVERWPTISDGSHYVRWLIPGKKKEREDDDFEAINELRIKEPE